jgi:hypothetical protein
MFRWIATQLRELHFLFFFLKYIDLYCICKKKIIAVRPSAEAVRENSELLENFFLACFSYGGTAREYCEIESRSKNYMYPAS